MSAEDRRRARAAYRFIGAYQRKRFLHVREILVRRSHDT